MPPIPSSRYNSPADARAADARAAARVTVSGDMAGADAFVTLSSLVRRCIRSASLWSPTRAVPYAICFGQFESVTPSGEVLRSDAMSPEAVVLMLDVVLATSDFVFPATSPVSRR